MNHRFDNALGRWAAAVASSIEDDLTAGLAETRLVSARELPELSSKPHLSIKFTFDAHSDGDWRVVVSSEEAELLKRLRVESMEEEDWLYEAIQEVSRQWCESLAPEFKPTEFPRFLELVEEPVPLKENLFTLINLPFLVEGEKFLEMRAILPAFLYEELRTSPNPQQEQESERKEAQSPMTVFAPLSAQEQERRPGDLGLVLDVPLELTVILGRTSVMLADLIRLGRGSVLELDRLAGEPVEMYVNDCLVGLAEIVVIDDRFGVRVLEMVDGRRPGAEMRSGAA